MKKSNQSAKSVMIIFVLIISLLVINVSYLGITGKHMVNGEDFKEFSQKLGSGQKTDILYAKRGTIYSSDDAVIASDVKKYKLIAYISTSRVGINNTPAYVTDKEKCAEKLANIIGLDKSKILKRLNSTGYQVEFGSYGNNLSAMVKAQIEALNISGLEFEEMTTRNYRFGDFASYEIGYAKVNVENNINSIVGEMGIEKLFNDELTGTNGSRVYLADNNGNTLPNGIISETAATAGNDIYLTINSELQTELDLQLQTLGDTLEASKATCGIMEAKTGKILAISNYPSFDPNKRDFDNYTDIFFSDAIEPGSVFKPFVYANALNDGVLDLNKYYESGRFKYNSKVTIKDHNNGVGWGSITYENGFYHSSNTAICSILTNYTKKESLIQDYKDLGFFQSSTIDRISSASGISGYSRSTSTQLEFLTTGFGQGSTVTALQLMRAYSAFANDGKTVEPYLVDKIVNSETNETIYEGETKYSKQIYSSSTVKKMRELLDGVVNKEGSTGYIYHMEDLRLIGKTGTGQIAENGSYSTTNYTHSFSGLAPYDDPQVVIVMWYQCKNDDSSVRANFIKTISQSAISLLNDQPTQKVKTSSFTLDSYLNHSTSYTKNILTSNSLVPIIIGNGDTVTDQYPKASTELTANSRVFIATDGTKITMPSMIGWSRKEAEAFASLAGIELNFKGVGTIYKQSVSKGKTLKDKQKVTVEAK
jgi:penicillin-binding protein 2B